MILGIPNDLSYNMCICIYIYINNIYIYINNIYIYINTYNLQSTGQDMVIKIMQLKPHGPMDDLLQLQGITSESWTITSWCPPQPPPKKGVL